MATLHSVPTHLPAPFGDADDALSFELRLSRDLDQLCRRYAHQPDVDAAVSDFLACNPCTLLDVICKLDPCSDARIFVTSCLRRNAERDRQAAKRKAEQEADARARIAEQDEGQMEIVPGGGKARFVTFTYYRRKSPSSTN